MKRAIILSLVAASWRGLVVTIERQRAELRVARLRHDGLELLARDRARAHDEADAGVTVGDVTSE